MSTSEILQAHLPTSKVVKAFNHICRCPLLLTDSLLARQPPLSAGPRLLFVCAGMVWVLR
jgi:hypothetical protein